MKRAHKAKSGSERRLRIASICRDAEALGVSRQHLRHVLAGRRTSARLMHAYRSLQLARRA